MPDTDEFPDDGYHCGRQHLAGPGAWCVRANADDDNFEMSVDDRSLGIAIALLMSGEHEQGAKALAEWKEAVAYCKEHGFGKYAKSDAEGPFSCDPKEWARVFGAKDKK